ncbi:hypothetical protein ASG99_04480 [Bacillus sp. Soil768D1]|nr:hypothetical protein ASG99_04480 [Bacillus sp. Soil768D1]
MIDLLKIILEKANIDTNLPEIERKINAYKIGRKKYLLLVLSLITYPTMIFYLSYLIMTKFPHNYLISFFCIVVIFLCGFLFKKQILKFVYILFYLIMPFLFTTTILKMYYEGFDLPDFILVFILSSFLLIIYSSFYLFTVDILTTKDELKLTFTLSENEEIEAILISVTKNGDYIVRLFAKEDQEVLIMKDYIKKITFHKATN